MAHYKTFFTDTNTDTNNDMVLYAGNNIVPVSPPPIGVDTVILTNGNKYYWNGTVWTVEPLVVLDGNDKHLTGTAVSVAPTAIEIPAPLNGDTSKKKLNNGNKEVWLYNGASWALITTVLPTTLDGNHTPVNRASATAGVAPTAIEVPTPISGDTASIKLTNGTEEFWKFTGAWALTYTNIPTVIPATTNTLTNPTNTITSTVNGIVATAPAVNTNVLAKPTANTIQSTVNGVASASVPIVATVANTSAVNSISTTVNGIAGTSVPIVNSNTLTKPTSNTIVSTVNGVASAAAPIIATNTLTSAAGGLTSTVNGVASAILPIFSTVLPLADGVTDTRVGAIGTSLLLARQDHIHPITRIAAPATPTITATGLDLLITAQSATSVTDEESVTFSFAITLTQAVGVVWHILNVPAIAGYQAPVIMLAGTYRSLGTPAGYPAPPNMGQECANWQNSTQIYMNKPFTVLTNYNVFFKVRYILA